VTTPVHRIARNLARRKIPLCYLDADDLVQEGAIAAWQKPEYPILAARSRMIDAMRQASGSRQIRINGKQMRMRCEIIRRPLVDRHAKPPDPLPSELREALIALSLTASRREIELAVSCWEHGADRAAETFGVTRKRAWQAVCVVVKSIREAVEAGRITESRLRDLLID
jgi:DNA-directed RNA polymerase specialized sigma24 family protein